MNKRKGISLIVLVITILVMIILAGVVVVSLQKNNPIEKAKEATFKQSLAQIGEELEMFCVNEKAQNSEFNKETLYASKSSLEFNTKIEAFGKNIYDIIPSLKDSKYRNQVEVIAGSLYYKTPDKKEIPWLRELGIYYTGIVTGTVIIEGDTLVGVSSDYVNTGTLIIPSTVKKINQGAFANCEDINAIVFQEPTDGSEGITEIPDNCFRKCKMLTSVKLPSTVKTIGNSAFRDCSSLESVVIPRDTTIIKGSAFQDCSKLTSVTFNNKLQEIWEYGFLNDYKLAELNLPESLRLVKRQVFQNTAINSIRFPDGMERIGYAALLGCPNLTEIYLGANLTVLEEALYRECPKLNKITINENNTNFSTDGKFTLYEKKVNPNTGVKEKVLKQVAQGATSINIDPDTKIIIDESFIYCKNIKEVIIPDGVREIKSRVFSNCTSLTKLVIPGSVEVLQTRVIEQTPLLDITIKPNANGVQNFIAENGVIFNGKKTLLISASNAVRPNKEYIIPDTVQWIDYCAFYGANNLNKITIPHSVTNIVSDAFSGTGISEIIIPSSVKEIGWNIVRFSQNIKRVVFEEGCTAPIPGYIMAGLKDATLIVPASTDYINPASMALSGSGCKVEISPSNPKYEIRDERFIVNKVTNRLVSGFNFKDSQTLPNVSGIEEQAFREMATGNKVIIPNTVTSLPTKLFLDNSRIREVILPASITQIAADTFITTPNLSRIIMGGREGSVTGAPWGATQGIKAVIWK